jgi:hypothetical protein
LVMALLCGSAKHDFGLSLLSSLLSSLLGFICITDYGFGPQHASDISLLVWIRTNERRHPFFSSQRLSKTNKRTNRIQIRIWHPKWCIIAEAALSSPTLSQPITLFWFASSLHSVSLSSFFVLRFLWLGIRGSMHACEWDFAFIDRISALLS